MKIAIYHNLTSGGSKRELYEFLRLMKKDNHLVHVYTTNLSDENFLSTKDYADKVFRYPLPVVDRFSRRLPGLRKYVDALIVLCNILKLRQISRQIAKDINNRDYNFVFVHHCRIVQSPFLLRYLKTPSIYYCNEPMRQFYEPEIKRPYTNPVTFIGRLQFYWYYPTKFLSLFIKYLDQKNIRKATCLITNSCYSAGYIKSSYGLGALVCYLGVDTEKFAPLDCAKKYRVISVGALSPLKGFDFIIEALSNINPEYRPEFLIVCNTISSGEKRYLEDLALDKSVDLKIKHNVSDEELVQLYNESLLFVYSAHHEPLGLAVLEAMACGLPVVAVSEGGVKETVKDGETGFFVKRDRQLFAESLHRLLSNEKLRKQLSFSSAQYARTRWQWNLAYERLIEIVDQTLKK